MTARLPKSAPINANKDPEVCNKNPLFDESLVVGADNGLKDVVIFVRTEGVPVAPSYADAAKADVVLDNKKCRFEPHVLLLRTTQTLILKNSDPVGHNSKIDPLRIHRPTRSFRPVKRSEEPAAERRKLADQCRLQHPLLDEGIRTVRGKTPYMAVSRQEEGKFEIDDLPVGKDLEFVWSGRKRRATSRTLRATGPRPTTKDASSSKIKADEAKPSATIKAPARSRSKEHSPNDPTASPCRIRFPSMPTEPEPAQLPE